MSCGCLNRERLKAANTKYTTTEERDEARKLRNRLLGAKKRRYTRKTRKPAVEATLRRYSNTRALNLAARGISVSLDPVDRGPDLPPLCACHHEHMRSNGTKRGNRVWRCGVARRAYDRQNDKYDPVKSEKQKRRRRAATRGVLSEPYTREEVYERDAGKCRYCDEHVTADWHVAHLLSLARGGEDTLDNVAVSCAACNIADGIGRLPVQLHLPRAA